ncbi:hypothetical protein ES705_08782 [subsurface metagenome]
MKRNKLRLISISILLFLALLLLNFGSTTLNSGASTDILPVEMDMSLNYTDSGPITIDSNDDFGVSGYGFPGTGTPGDPYLIKELRIVTAADRAIDVVGVTVSFTIEDCYLDANFYGIRVDAESAGQVIVINNTIVGNTREGLYILRPDGVQIRNNTFSGNGLMDIRMSFSDSTIIANNTFISSERAIAADNNLFLTIENNTFTETGIYIFNEYYDYAGHTIRNNFVNGKPLGYYTDISDVTIAGGGYGQLIIANSDNVTIRDHHIDHASIGILCQVLTNSLITNNTLEYNKYAGLFLRWCSNLIVDSNDFSYSSLGTGIYNSVSSHVVFSNNQIHDNYDGAYNINCNNITYFNNTLENMASYGLRMQSNQEATILNNTLINAGRAILLWSFQECNVTYNLIKDCGGEGINIDYGSEYNVIHHNFFINNNGGTDQAFSNDVNNLFYDIETSVGNYWSDYSGTGDYLIGGSAGLTDPNVIVDNTQPSIMDKSVDLIYIV